MKLLSIALACALLAGTGSQVANADAGPALRAQETPQAAASTADAAVVAYGTWAQQLQEALAPLLAAFARLGDRAQAGSRSSASLAEALREVEQVQRLADEAAGRIGALAAPDVSILPLEAELTPAALQREQLGIVAEIKRMAGQAAEALSATAQGKTAEANRAALAMVDTAQTMLRQRVLFLRATQAVTPREDSSWDLTNGEIVIFGAIGRMMSVLMADGTQADPAVARDLRSFADQLAKSRRAAESKLRAEAEELDDWLANAADAAPDEVRLARRVKEVVAAGGRETALFKEWEQLLREAAASVESPSVARAALSNTFATRMRDLRQRGDAIIADLTRAMSAQ